MNQWIWVGLLCLSFMFSLVYKAGSNFLEEYRHALISEQICRASGARLQVGTTREVVDLARAALVGSGYPEAQVTLREGDITFIESTLDPMQATSLSCPISGRENVELSLHFPKLEWIDTPFFIAWAFSLTALISLRIFLSLFLKGVQSKFMDETDRRLSNVLGLSSHQNVKSPVWMEWLYKTDPKSVSEFKRKLTRLEEKIDRQAQDLKHQALEKATKELQLVQARKFKDLAHQIRHDLRQTLGVIKSSVETLPNHLPESQILVGSVHTLETMIEDLKERERSSSENSGDSFELVEVVMNEVVKEQRVYLGPQSPISISLVLEETELNLVKIPPIHLKRVFTNLIRNSVEAIPGVGSVRVSVSRSSQSKVLISIEDSGIGFSEEALKSLFKKGFTTKPSGSGRGLSFCQEKVREWGGTILVDSIPGRTRIDIELPLADLPIHFVSPAVLRSENALLVVDDHPLESEMKSLSSSAEFVTSLEKFSELSDKTGGSFEKMIVFDLHLGVGKKALEAVGTLADDQDYVFMTSDYLNSELLVAAQKLHFLIIPKDLLGLALKAPEKMDRSFLSTGPARSRPELSAQI